MADILVTDSADRFAGAVQRAAELLKRGEVVAVPTETVYGLAANALDSGAVERLFEIKGRPFANPVIVHVVDREMAQACAAAWPEAAERMARAFWPGPLTMVLPKAPTIPPTVTAGGGTVAVRCPSHPFMRALIRACGFPLAAPSANRSTELSPTTAEHVVKSLGSRIPLIIDAGPCAVGIESTVVDLSDAPARVLRPGMLGRAEIEQAGVRLAQEFEPAPGGPARSPGFMERHYAPKARLFLLEWKDTASLLAQMRALNLSLSHTFILAHNVVPNVSDPGRVSIIPSDPAAFARGLYAELHRCDEAGAAAIVVEAPPQSDEWRGIHDRLNRALAR